MRCRVTAVFQVSDGRQGDTTGEQTVATNVTDGMRYDEAAVALSCIHTPTLYWQYANDVGPVMLVFGLGLRLTGLALAKKVKAKNLADWPVALDIKIHLQWSTKANFFVTARSASLWN